MPSIPAADALAPYVLVIDAGSSSVRASVWDGRARAVAGWEAREETSLHVGADGSALEPHVRPGAVKKGDATGEDGGGNTKPGPTGRRRPCEGRE